MQPRSDNDIIRPEIISYIDDSVISKVIKLWKLNSLPTSSELLIKRYTLSLGFTWLGSGSYRFAVDIGDEMIAKISWGEGGAIRLPGGEMMNKKEYENQNLFMDHFPKIYGHGSGKEGEGFGWIISEKVNIITKEDELLKWIPELSELKTGDYDDFFKDMNEFDILVFLLDACQSGKIEGNPAMNNKAFSEICSAISTLNIDIGDITAGNLGWKDDRLLIIDGSYYE